MADKAVDKPANLLEVRGLTRTFASRNGLFGKKRVMTAVGDVTLDVPHPDSPTTPNTSPRVIRSDTSSSA